MTATTRSSPRRRSPSRGSAFANVVMVVGLCYFILPLVWLVLASTKTESGLFDSFGYWVATPFNLFQNISDVFTRDHGAYLTWTRNTAIYALSAATLSTVIAALAGYAFAVYDFRGRKALFAIVVGSVFVPGSVVAVPLFLMMSRFGLSNTLLAVILPALVNPFGVYLMKVYAEHAIPRDLIDAGRVDGAGELRIFASIAFRLLAPGLVTVFLLAFVGAWNNYFLPLLLLGKSDLFTLSVGLAYWNSLATQPGSAQFLYALVVTASLMAVIPVMIAFFIVQRYWEGGLTVGGVKE
jgi:multiple sugar transport system permease protein